MIAAYERVETEPAGAQLVTRFELAPPKAAGVCLGWQLYDPASGAFLAEGEWQPAEAGPVRLAVELPAEAGLYHVYVSTRDDARGWHFAQHYPFLLIEAAVAGGQVTEAHAEVTTLGRVQRRHWPRKLQLALVNPFATIWRNRRLIASLVRREITARYRGSLGGTLWTILHPLLLMLTYFFVFGIVLQTRFGTDPSRSGFVLYFLAGMLPWLPIAEAVGRSPAAILENRNFVKKLVFPVETLPVNYVLAGLVTEAFALAIFLLLLTVTRGVPPVTLLWLPALLVPQFLLTLGVCWTLSALGVFLRDLGQMIGFVLTLVFFLTPICYPETSLPGWAHQVLTKNPVFVLVNAYRDILLNGHAPDWVGLGALTVFATALFFAGHALFWRLRKTFADVI